MSETTPDKIQCRCPHCSKLYEINAQYLARPRSAGELEVQGNDDYAWVPQFKCVTCEGLFKVELPETDFTEASAENFTKASAEKFTDKAMEISKNEISTVSREEKSPKKDCPRCHASVNLEYIDCPKCGVVFARLDKNDPMSKTPPEMLSAWTDLLSDYQSRDLHQKIILLAVKNGHVKWLADQYLRLKAAQGGEDKLGDAMVSELYLRSGNSGAKQVPITPSIPLNQQILLKQRNERYLWMIPYAMSGVVIALGMIHGGHRNMIGLGMALMCLSYGVHSLFKNKRKP